MGSKSEKKISILYIDNAVSFGGAIISISHLLRHLDLNKFTPVMISELDQKILSNHIPDKIRIYNLKHWLNYFHWSKINSISKKIKSIFFRKIFIYSLATIRILTDCIYFIKLLSICSKQKPDIIHINNGLEIGEANFISKLFNIKCIVHQRGDSSANFFRKYFFKSTDTYIAVSEYTKQNMISWGIPEYKILVMHDPVLPQSTDLLPIPFLKKKCSEKYFGIFGRVMNWKGQKIFVEAAINILKKYPHYTAFIIGDSADSDKAYFMELKDMARKSDVNDRICFTGYIQNLSVYYSIMDVVVHASITPEPFGMVINEAMMHGVPVIASNEGGPVDIIENGVDGLLIRPGDPKLLENTLITLLTDDKKRLKIGKKAKEKVLKKFDADNYSKKMESLYINLTQPSVGK